VRRKRVYLVLCGILAALLILLLLAGGNGRPVVQTAEDTEAVYGRPAAPTSKPPTAVVDPGPLPDEQRETDPLLPALQPARVAIIIDDVGYDGNLDALAAGIPFPLTFSILPGLDHSAESAVRLYNAGFEIMLHLPMEPDRYPEKNPGPGALYTFMTEEEIVGTLRDDLLSVPDARGVNNHMGSLFTLREDLLEVVFGELRRRGLYFIDSRTVSSSAAYTVARRLGVRSARRSVFLDNVEDEEAITDRLEELFETAARAHSAIGIGHHRETTLLVLAAEIPRLLRQHPDVELVYASHMVN